MEENTPGNSNWNQTSVGWSNKDLPDSTASFILGIVGLVLSVCLGCGIVGFILSILAMVKGNKMVKLYEANPGVYSNESFKNAKTGRVLGIIGFVLGVVVMVILIVFFGSAIMLAILGESK